MNHFLRDMPQYILADAATLADLDTVEERAYVANELIRRGDAWLCCAWMTHGDVHDVSHPKSDRPDVEPWWSASVLRDVSSHRYMGAAHQWVRFQPYLCCGPLNVDDPMYYYHLHRDNEAGNVLTWLPAVSAARMSDAISELFAYKRDVQSFSWEANDEIGKYVRKESPVSNLADIDHGWYHCALTHAYFEVTRDYVDRRNLTLR